MSFSVRHSCLFVTATLLLAMLASLDWLPPPSIQLLLLAVLVAVAGLPHGAMDPLVARQAGIFSGLVDGLQFISVYLLQAIATVFFWLMFPFIALPAFLAISAWHFAGDWRPRLPYWLCLLGGVNVVLAPVVFHGEAVAQLFGLLSDTNTAKTLASWLRIPGLLTIAALLITAGFYRVRMGWAGLELAAIVILAWALPPLLYFAVYFCGLHSPRHVLEVTREYRINVREAVGVSVVFTLLAIVFATVFFFTVDGPAASEKTVRILFVGLAAVTVPHMILLARTSKVRIDSVAGR